MRIDSLIMEVTRRCNMACKHCLRGDAENQDMTREIVDKTFEGVDEVGTITFSGGEPFLNLDIIKYILQVVKEKSIFVGSFYLVTNGKEFKQENIDVMNEWMAYTTANYFGNNMLDSKGYFNMEDYCACGAVCVSRDAYHEPIPMENYLKYRSLSYYSTDKEASDDFAKYIRDEGKANENGIGKVPTRVSQMYIDGDWEKVDGKWQFINRVVEEVYVSSNGEVVPDCDYSYDHQDDFSIGNLYDASMKEIFDDYIKNTIEAPEDDEVEEMPIAM
jgi:organic radical activating enzyme